MGIRDATASVETDGDGRTPVDPGATAMPVAPGADDEDDDDLPWRRRRRRGLEEEEPPGDERPAQDPDQVERQKRVEVYRRLWEQDSTRSLFVRPESPKPRRWKPANTWATGRA